MVWITKSYGNTKPICGIVSRSQAHRGVRGIGRLFNWIKKAHQGADGLVSPDSYPSNVERCDNPIIYKAVDNRNIQLT